MVVNTVGVEGEGRCVPEDLTAMRCVVIDMEELWVVIGYMTALTVCAPFGGFPREGTPPIGRHHIIDIERIPSIESRRWGA